MHSVDSLKAFVAAGGGRDASHRVVAGVVVFGAGKGGVGTSMLAGLVALQAARRGATVLLVDADETVGSLHLMFGVQGEIPGLGTLRGGDVMPEDLLRSVAPGLTLFPGGGGGLDATLSVAAAERRMLLRRVAGLYERYDLVVVDGGSRLDSVMASCAAGAERVVCVTTADRIAQAAAYALLKVVRGRFGDLSAELVVNRAADAAARAAHGLVKAASVSFLEADVDYGGGVPEDSELADLLAAGGSLADSDPQGPASVATGGIADRLLLEQDARTPGATAVLPLQSGVVGQRR